MSWDSRIFLKIFEFYLETFEIIDYFIEYVQYIKRQYIIIFICSLEKASKNGFFYSLWFAESDFNF